MDPNSCRPPDPVQTQLSSIPVQQAQGQIQELKGEGPKLNIHSAKILPFAIPTLV